MDKAERNPDKSHALIIAAGQFKDSGLARLRSPSRDAEELASVLQDPLIGGYEVRSLLNKPAHVVSEEIEAFFAEALPADLLLLYISSHGVKDPAGQLVFAMTTTKLNRLQSTGIRADFLYEQIERCRCRRIVVLLDCCYSGAYLRGHRPRGRNRVSLGSLGGRGWAVITSSTAMEYAFEIDGDQITDKTSGTRPEPSVFTAAIVEGLRTGEADRDRDGKISIDDLYGYVSDRVRQRTPYQTPEKKWGDVRGDFFIARNPNPPPAPSAEALNQGADLRGTARQRPTSRRRVLTTLIGVCVAAGVGAGVWELNNGPKAKPRGTAIWSFYTGGAVYGQPAVADRVVYVGSTSHSVYALSASNGNQIWAFLTGGDVYNDPVLAGNVVYIGSTDGMVYALDVRRGAQIWTFPTTNNVNMKPKLGGGVLYVGSSDGRVYALETSKGNEIWSFNTGGPVYSGPAVADNLIYVGSDDHNVYALRARDGNKIWSVRTGGPVRCDPVVDHDVLYVGSEDGNVYALHTVNGAIIWTFPAGPVGSDPAVANGVIYVPTEDGNVFALDAASGRRIWKFPTGLPVSDAAVANGVVYFGSLDGKIYALNANNGTKVWEFATGNTVGSGPAVANGIVYVGSNDGNLYALRA